MPTAPLIMDLTFPPEYTLDDRQLQSLNRLSDFYRPVPPHAATSLGESEDLHYEVIPIYVDVPTAYYSTVDTVQTTMPGRATKQIVITLDKMSLPQELQVEDGWLVVCYDPKIVGASIAEEVSYVCYIMNGNPWLRPGSDDRTCDYAQVFLKRTPPPEYLVPYLNQKLQPVG